MPNNTQALVATVLGGLLLGFIVGAVAGKVTK